MNTTSTITINDNMMFMYNPKGKFNSFELNQIRRCGLESLITAGCDRDKVKEFLYHCAVYESKPFFEKEFRDKILNNVSKKFTLDDDGNIWLRLNFFDKINENTPLQYQINANFKKLELSDYEIERYKRNDYLTEILLRGYQKGKGRMRGKGGRGKGKGKGKPPQWDNDTWYQIKLSLINHGHTFEADLPESWGRDENMVLSWFLQYWEQKFVPRLMKMSTALENHFKNRIIRWAAKNRVFLSNY